ncbi:Uncharacterised protein [Vibrio cholerae]|nr:Uncharacterised protein [Vibrio cholerae]
MVLRIWRVLISLGANLAIGARIAEALCENGCIA